MQVLTPKGEFAYVNVFRPGEPMEGSDKDPQYQLTVIWDEDDPKLQKLEDKILEVAKAKFGAKAEQMITKGQLKTPLRDGSERDTDFLQGKKFMTARSNDRPDCVDADLEDIIDSKEVYPGAIGRMDVWLYAYDKAGNKGVAAILNNVQKLEEGERKGGRRSASDAFSEDDEEDDGGRRGGSSRRGRDSDDEDRGSSRRGRSSQTSRRR